MPRMRVVASLGCAALLWAVSARAEPIGSTFVLDLGTITLNGGSSVLVPVSGLDPRRDYTVAFTLLDPVGSAFSTLTAELLDPLSDGFDAMDGPQPDYVPAGYSTSNNTDGLSFAWNSGLERSATFAGGGSATLYVDEDTNARDLLAFHGFTPGDSAMTTFGLRDNLGGRNFLLRLSVDAVPSGTPEPASLLLLGTGLAGLYGVRRRLAA